MGAVSGPAQAWAAAYCKDSSENSVGTMLVGKNNGAHLSQPTEKSYMRLEYLSLNPVICKVFATPHLVWQSMLEKLPSGEGQTGREARVGDLR